MLARRSLLSALAAWSLGPLAPRPARAEVADALQRESLRTPRARDAVLLGIARAGERLVAVGERGVVLLSDDQGAAWRQAQVPVSTTLTAVRFVDARSGWAVGHAGVVLHTADGGQTWVRQLDGAGAADLVLKVARTHPERAAELRSAERLVSEGADKPLLDLHFFDARRGFVIGAYGLALGTEDGGANWVSWVDRIENPNGLHINAAAVQGSLLILAGEQGRLWRSTDGGAHFAALKSPYPGSWFAVSMLPSGRIVVAGLKGNAFVSDDQGESFTAAAVPIPVTLSILVRLNDGSLLALNQAGQALLSTDQGRVFKPLALPPGAPMTALLQLADGAMVGTSLRGARQIPRPQ